MSLDRRLLIVEPDRELREVLSEVVGDLGVAVDVVPDLAAAEAALVGVRYALVLADVDRRPFDFAAGVARLVRSAAPVRVVAMTALPFDEVGAARSGAVAVLQKPFSVETLVKLLAAELPSETQSDRRALVGAYFDALSNADWDTLASLCSSDVVYELPGRARFATTVRGRAAFRDFSAATFREFPESRFTLQELLPIVGGAIARYRGTWRGADAPFEGAVLFGFDGPLIRRIKVELDLDRLIAAMPAVAPTPAV